MTLPKRSAGLAPPSCKRGDAGTAWAPGALRLPWGRTPRLRSSRQCLLNIWGAPGAGPDARVSWAAVCPSPRVWRTASQPQGDNASPVRMAIIKKSTNSVSPRMWREGSPHALLVGMQTGAAAVADRVEVPQKVKNNYFMTQQ